MLPYVVPAIMLNHHPRKTHRLRSLSLPLWGEGGCLQHLDSVPSTDMTPILECRGSEKIGAHPFQVGISSCRVPQVTQAGTTVPVRVQLGLCEALNPSCSEILCSDVPQFFVLKIPQESCFPRTLHSCS